MTAVKLSDGSAMAAPTVHVQGLDVVLRWKDGETRVANNAVEDISTYRHWLGSDRFGEDVAIQLLRGGRLSLAVAALSALVALLIGTAVGIGSATSGRLLDGLLMRLVDGLLAFPVLFLMILVVVTNWIFIPRFG